ncbi:MAG: SUMF1/EgtB/PvdO family nonheme iron enzyme, partial [Bacteroidales bacterium]|nr:SUMF1/EgtB/PvdO family nonheme iron enzyme [Bacteroidales bacterium]
MPHDVFISYSSVDREAADTVCSILEEKGIRCWIAPRDITPGLPFAEAIIDGIKSSKVFILVYSSNSNHSSQVIKEVDRAVHHGLSIINLRLENIPLSKQLEYYISDVHWLDAQKPPLEQYMDRLSTVVQMLLAMDEVDKGDIEEALKNETIKQEEPGKPVRKNAARKILIPVIAIFLLLIIPLAIFFFNRKAKVRQVRQEVIPEIERLIGENDVWRNLVKPYRLAEQAEAVLGDDPELAKQFSQVSLRINVITDPPGARVYMKEYVDSTRDWTYLGITPLDSVRVPVGIFRWKLEKEGYEPVLAAATTWQIGITENNLPTVVPNDFSRRLDPVGSTPKDMVRVPSTELEIGKLGDFLIGRYEVTNREYKAFIDNGGYQNKEYWKYAFVKDGNEISWEEGIKQLVDKSEQPGPSTWIGGDYPAGQGDYPVSGLCWYEAAAYAEYTGMSLPTAYHWAVAAGRFTTMLQVPQLGGFAILAPFSNFARQGTVAVGSMSGITAYGAHDMAGNVREWCSNETKMGRIIRGGSWEDNTYEFENLRQAPAMDRSPRNGIRLAFYPDSEAIPKEVFEPMQLTQPIDIHERDPVPDAIFRVYKEQFG